MFKITNVEIENFRSIEKMTFSFDQYANSKSSTSIILGVNESGKSNFLKILSILDNHREVNYTFANDCHHENQDHASHFFIRYYLEIVSPSLFSKLLSNETGIPTEFSESITFKHIYLRFSKDKTDIQTVFYVFDYTVDLFHKLFLDNSTGKLTLKDQNTSPLDLKALKDYLRPFIDKIFNMFIPKVVYWTPDKDLLAKNISINLREFINSPSQYKLLIDIFRIYGVSDSKNAEQIINKALSNPAKKAELQDKLSYAVTSHVNNIWKEHKINFKFNIDGEFLSIVIEDKDSSYQYYNMNQRSDGFIQFISFILSLSAQNIGAGLKNTLILIDEPENHLHPSGIRYMRDELLKIGENNQVVVSTHSQYLIDVNCMERHWIMNKTENKSTLEQVGHDKSLFDQEILAKAFGLKLMKELVPENIIIVEGKSDKIFLERIIKLFIEDYSYVIKIAGGTKIYGVASILASEEFKPFVFLDSDDQGEKDKSDIIKNLKSHYNKDSVKTLKDLGYTKYNKASIEDLYPRSFVKEILSGQFSIDISHHDDKPVMEAISIIKPDIKKSDQLKEIKIELSNKFAASFDSVEKIKNEASDMHHIAENFVQLLQKQS